MTPTIATPDTFDAQLSSHDGLTVAYFWGPDCPNCEVFARDAPELFAALPPDVRLLKINAYEFPELAQRYALFGIPAFVLFRGRAKLGMMRQYHGRDYWLTVVREQHAAGPP